MKVMSKAILSTLAYYSVFDYPLTIIELWQWLYWDEINKPDFEDYQLMIIELKEKNIISICQGFVCLIGRENDVIKRQQNYRDSFAKYELARKISRVFAFIPFVKAVFICNSLAYNNSRLEGDIDLFIVTNKNRLWLTRFLTLSLLKLFKLRPVANYKKNKIDPTFFVNSDNLDLETIALDDDIYLKYWLAQLSPIYDPNKIILEIRQSNKKLLKVLPNSLPVQPHSRRIVKHNWLISLIRFKWKILFNYQCLENLSYRFQMKIMPGLLKSQLNKNKGVVANEQMIKMHSHDRRQEYANEWREAAGKLIKIYEDKTV